MLSPPGLQKIRGLLQLQVPQSFPSLSVAPKYLASLHSGHKAWSLSVMSSGQPDLVHPSGPVSPSPPPGLLTEPQVTC